MGEEEIVGVRLGGKECTLTLEVCIEVYSRGGSLAELSIVK